MFEMWRNEHFRIPWNGANHLFQFYFKWPVIHYVLFNFVFHTRCQITIFLSVTVLFSLFRTGVWCDSHWLSATDFTFWFDKFNWVQFWGLNGFSVGNRCVLHTGLCCAFSWIRCIIVIKSGVNWGNNQI